MERTKEKTSNIIYIIFGAVLALSVILFLYTGKTQSNQSMNAMYPSAVFQGEVKIGDGEWKPYVKGKHIPSTKGDVVLKGNFELFSSDASTSLGRPQEGAFIALYLNHINGTVTEDGGDTHYLDIELDVAGEDMCGVMYIGYQYRGGDVVEITLSNPHKFGNENAVDQLLDNLSIYGGTAFENDIRQAGSTQRTLGIVLVLFACVVLGAAVISLLIHMKGSKQIWFIGFAVLFAGIYFLFSAKGVIYWSEFIKFNTRILGGSIMLYMLCVEAVVASVLNEKTKKAGNAILFLMGFSIIVFLAIPALSPVKFYDMLLPWALLQSIACVVMTGLLMYEFSSNQKNEITYAVGMLPNIACVIDVTGTYFGWWQGGLVSGIVFVVLFLVAALTVLKIIPQNVNAASKARELEIEKKNLKAELAESRIAIMISQIQPHFIYNTLGTIEVLCVDNPQAAAKLVRNFSLYLRGNFSELDNTRPIMFSKEMEHVKHYTDIEQVRFPDMTIKYDLRSVEFVLPALSVQPLVENAIKHGLMGLEKGGTVTITAYETEEFYIVEVSDNGIGFDSNADYDETKHVGIKNIRGRISEMCGGTLSVESSVGNGTKATLKIPKEGKVNESDSSR